MKPFDWQDDYYNTERRDLRNIRSVLIITMLLNFLAMAVKLAAGFITGSLSVVADALDSFFDGLSNVVGLAGVYAAGKPPDADHPYGHRKFETVAALSIAFLLFLTTFQLLQSAWSRLREPAPLEVNALVVVAMVVAMLIQAGTSVYELRKGRRLKSEMLVADALHTRASILVSLGVLVGLVLVRLGFPAADPIMAVFVAIMIAKIGVDILKETLPVLVDQAPIDPRQIAGLVATVPGVESFHRVRSRGPEGSAAVDLHVRVSPEIKVQDATAIGDEVRRRLLALEAITDVTVHVEAAHSGSVDSGDIYATLKLAAGGLGLRVHEAWTQRLDGRLYLETHLGVDPELTLGQAHALVEHLERDLLERLPMLSAVHTHIETALSQVQEGSHVQPEFEEQVRGLVISVLQKYPQIGGLERLEVRRSIAHPEKQSIIMEVSMQASLPVAQAHELSSQVEHDLNSRLPSLEEVFIQLTPETDLAAAKLNAANHAERNFASPDLENPAK